MPVSTVHISNYTLQENKELDSRKHHVFTDPKIRSLDQIPIQMYRSKQATDEGGEEGEASKAKLKGWCAPVAALLPRTA